LLDDFLRVVPDFEPHLHVLLPLPVAAFAAADLGHSDYDRLDRSYFVLSDSPVFAAGSGGVLCSLC